MQWFNTNIIIDIIMAIETILSITLYYHIKLVAEIPEFQDHLDLDSIHGLCIVRHI